MQYSAHSVTGGLGVVAGYLFTTAELTIGKQVIPSFALSPYGGRVAVKRQQNRRKEGVCVSR